MPAIDDAEHDQPKSLPVSDTKTIARGLGVGDRLVGQLTECVARRIISGARGAAINRQCLRLAVGARQHQHLVDDLAVVGPALFEAAV